MRRAVERVFKVSVSSEEELLELVDAICNKLSFVDLNITCRARVIKIHVRGSHSDVRRAAGLIKEIVSMSRRKSRLRLMGINVFEARELSKEAGMAISLELLAEALRLRGFNCRVVESRVETNAGEDVVFEVARLIGAAYEGLRFETRSSSVKKLLALASSASGHDVWTVIGVAEELRLIRRNDSGMLIPLRDWKQALSVLIDALKRADVNEYVEIEDSDLKF